MRTRFSPYVPEDEAESPTLKRWALLQRVAQANAEGRPSLDDIAAPGEVYPAQEPGAEPPVAAPENRHGRIGAWTRDAQGRLVAPKITYD